MKPTLFALTAARTLAARAAGAPVRCLSVFAPFVARPTLFGASRTAMRTITPFLSRTGAARHLNLHEYQSKDLMESYGVVVQPGRMASTPEEAFQIATKLQADNPGSPLVVKAQIHAGGRGKGTFDSGFKGGVHVCATPAQAKDFASHMLGRKLVTKQTGPEGQLTSKVLVNASLEIEKEYYFAVLMDRSSNGPVLVASSQGGMDIEEVAEKSPEAVVKLPVDIVKGLTDEAALGLAKKIGFEGDLATQAAKQFKALYALFLGTDATQVEINPLAVGHLHGQGKKVYAVDAKLNFDDNAAFRQRPLFEQRDKAMEDPRDVAAEEIGLNYIGLDGNIGCLVNGAGLAMATMDIIKLHGGEPANFLDVGGGATAQQVTQAFTILTGDKRVKALLVNIFGGIMKCDTIANGIVEAAKNVKLTTPLVVRLEGTNVAEGKAILNSSGIKLTTADDLDDAAKKAVKQIKA